MTPQAWPLVVLCMLLLLLPTEAGAAPEAAPGLPPQDSPLEDLELRAGSTWVLQTGDRLPHPDGTQGRVIDGTLSLDLRATLSVGRNGRLHTLIETGHGEGLDARMETLSGINHDACNLPHYGNSELWYEHTWFQEALRLRLGKIDLTTDFDTNSIANSEHDQFLSSAFVNNASLDLPRDNGMGLMLWIKPAGLWKLGLGLANANASWEDLFTTPFALAEFHLMPKLRGLQGNYRIYAWYNGMEHTDLSAPAVTDAVNHGFGISLDQEIARHLTLFFRYGQQRPEVSVGQRSLSGGIHLAGAWFGRKKEGLAVAFGTVLLSDAYRKARRTQGHLARPESHLEAYYLIQLNQQVQVTPDLQWVIHPPGIAHHSVFIFGIRLRIAL